MPTNTRSTIQPIAGPKIVPALLCLHLVESARLIRCLRIEASDNLLVGENPPSVGVQIANDQLCLSQTALHAFGLDEVQPSLLTDRSSHHRASLCPVVSY